jgi:hypothetical protein
MILMPAMNSALYCCIYYHVYIYIIIYIYTHAIDNVLIFSQWFMFLEKYVFDIEQT